MNENFIYLANMNKGTIYEVEKKFIHLVSSTFDDPNIRFLKTPEDIIQADFDIYYKGIKTLEEYKSEYVDDEDLIENILCSDAFGLSECDIENDRYFGIELKTLILDFNFTDVLNLEK